MAKIYNNPDTWITYTMLADRDNIDDPATVEIKPVPHGEVERYSRIIAKDAEGKSAAGQAAVLQNVTKKQFEEHIRNPCNFYRGPNPDKGEKEPVTLKSAAELYEHGDSEDINEIIKAMESNSKLTEGQKKTSASPSGSASQDSTGTAQNVPN